MDNQSIEFDNQSIEFAFKYGKLYPTLQRIIEYLYMNGKFTGNYKDLTKQFGQKTSVCQDGKTKSGNESNIRKHILQLEEMNIVTITYGKNHIKTIRLTDNWIENI